MLCGKCKTEKDEVHFFQSQRWCKECSRAYQKKWKRDQYNKNPEDFIRRVNKWRTENPEKVKEISRKAIWKLKLSTIKAYSKDMSCSCCGEKEIRFLTIDHIKNNGASERRKIFGKERCGSGSPFYRWLKRNFYPKDYQVLCYNCNCAKGFYGECPHKLEK